MGGQAGAAGPGEEQAARQRELRLLVRRELATRGGDQQLVEVGADEGQARRVRRRQLDDVEQVAGGGVAAHLALAPRGEPEVAGCVDAQAVGHRVGELAAPGVVRRRLRRPGRSRAPRPDGSGRCRRCRAGSRRGRTPCRWRGRGRRRAPWSCRRRCGAAAAECRAPGQRRGADEEAPCGVARRRRSTGRPGGRRTGRVRRSASRRGRCGVSRWCSATTRAPSAASATRADVRVELVLLLDLDRAGARVGPSRTRPCEDVDPEDALARRVPDGSLGELVVGVGDLLGECSRASRARGSVGHDSRC